MPKMQKGSLTRKSILENSRKVFNEKGILLTLDTIAAEIGINKGRVTNHFSTKEKLFLSILSEYEEQLGKRLSDIKEKYQSSSLKDIAEITSYIMDIQFEYRSCILYVIVYRTNDKELLEHISLAHQDKAKRLHNRISGMVKDGLMHPDVLKGDKWKSFLFMYVNQMNYWVIHLNTYDYNEGYKVVKPIYLRGIMTHTYGPYLTEKGLSALHALKFDKIAAWSPTIQLK